MTLHQGTQNLKQQDVFPNTSYDCKIDKSIILYIHSLSKPSLYPLFKSIRTKSDLLKISSFIEFISEYISFYLYYCIDVLPALLL